LVRFSSFASRGAVVSQFEVLDIAWVEEHGGKHLEASLIRQFSEEFISKGGEDVLSFPKAIAKLKKQVKRTKEILSANSEAPISVEELHDGIDFRSSITREHFETLNENFWDRSAAPLIELLKRNNLTGADLAAVELLGGSSRVPKVKVALSEALGGRSLDM
jgi:hypoxia up-regulated 1